MKKIIIMLTIISVLTIGCQKNTNNEVNKAIINGLESEVHKESNGNGNGNSNDYSEVAFNIIEGNNTQTNSFQGINATNSIHSISLIRKANLSVEELETMRFTFETDYLLKVYLTVENKSEKEEITSHFAGLLNTLEGKGVGEFARVKINASDNVIQEYGLLNTNKKLKPGEAVSGIAYIEIYRELDLNNEYNLIVSPLVNPIQWIIKAEK